MTRQSQRRAPHGHGAVSAGRSRRRDPPAPPAAAMPAPRLPHLRSLASSAATTRKRAKNPYQKYQLLLQPVLMPRISTGCNNSWYLWPAVFKGRTFGTGLKHHPVPKLAICTGWCHQPVPKAQGGIGTGWWHQSMPNALTMTPDLAMTRCHPGAQGKGIGW